MCDRLKAAAERAVLAFREIEMNSASTIVGCIGIENEGQDTVNQYFVRADRLYRLRLAVGALDTQLALLSSVQVPDPMDQEEHDED